MWKIPFSIEKLLRKHSVTICSQECPYIERLNLFFVILKPALWWVKRRLVENGLVKDEITSEFYLLCNTILKRYDPAKSSLIPYLLYAVPQAVSKLIDSVAPKGHESLLLEITEENQYVMMDEIYLSTPALLFEDRWLLKNLQRSQKSIINNIIASESDDLNIKKLANSSGFSHTKMYRCISELADILTERGFYDH